MNHSREHSRTQLSLEELQQLRWLLGGMLTLLSVVTVFYLEVDAWTLMSVTVFGVVAALARPDWPARVPPWVHRLAFPFIAAFFSGDLWLTGELLPAIVRLDILLLCYRGIIYRQTRDDLQVIVLGLFLVVVAGVLSVSLTFAVHILAFTAGALAFLLVITLSRATGEGSSDSAPVGKESEVPGWARQVDWGRLLGRVREVTDWRVVALGGTLFAGLVAMSALLFLAIPRFQLENSFFLERFISKKAKSGFSDTIRFGDVTEITLDDSVALSVDVSQREAIPSSPYWRMLVLDEYREGTFRLSPALRNAAFWRERGGMNVRGSVRGGNPDAAFWTFYLESGVSRYLPLLGRFQSMQFRERQNYRFGEALGIIALREEPVTMTAYRVDGMELGGPLLDRMFAARLREQAGAGALMLRVGVNETDRAVLDEAVKSVTGGSQLSAGEFARRAEAWLTQRHAYSLQPRIPAGEGDPLVRWLVSSEVGHCELFAGSLVLLARSAGIPARVVTGFRGGSWNGYSNNFTLRNSDAHAWCEVFDLATESWLRADPTPGAAAGAQDESRGEGSLTGRTDRSWTARLESLRVFWYRRIVNFDQQSQLETLQAVKEATENSGKWLREWLERAGGKVKAWLSAPWDGRKGMGLFAGLLLVAVTLWLAKNRRFAMQSWFGKNRRKGNAVRMEAGRWLRRMKEYEATRATSDDVVRDLERVRYGAQATWGDVPAVLRAARQNWRARKRRRRD